MTRSAATTAKGEDLASVVFTLRQLAAELTGFSPDAIMPEALRRALRLHLSEWTIRDLVLAADRRDEMLVRVLQQAVSVGETYFFRHPEQFEHLVNIGFPELARARGDSPRPWMLWSAGCATGEETYTLAACVSALRGRGFFGDAKVKILGTDLLERNVATARTALYGRWSVRSSGPELYPALTQESRDQVRVIDSVRQLVEFSAHNLLQPPPMEAGQVDVIFCRNVLVYFSPESAAKVVEQLIKALAPGGLIAFGPMDVPSLPEGLVRYGPAELQLYQRARAPAIAPPPRPNLRIEIRSAPRPRPVEVKPAPAPAPVPTTGIEPVALHLKVLRLVEAGEDAKALQLLEELAGRAPEYVPGLTEHALVLGRTGDIARASTRMREVIRLTSHLPEDTLLPGPEPLPAQFYASTAEAFLERFEGSH